MKESIYVNKIRSCVFGVLRLLSYESCAMTVYSDFFWLAGAAPRISLTKLMH